MLSDQRCTIIKSIFKANNARCAAVLLLSKSSAKCIHTLYLAAKVDPQCYPHHNHLTAQLQRSDIALCVIEEEECEYAKIIEFWAIDK